MSFLKNVLGEVSGSGADLGGLDIGNIAKSLLSSGGGSPRIDTIVNVLKQNGLEDKVSSWVGNGANASVDASEIQSALDQGTISDLSNELGIDASKVAPILAALLPVIINQLTPDGQESGDGSLLSSGINVLKGFM
ncbi:MAG: hypothetical protein CMN76_19010 [Spirochaetaceae bacterium]|nr:hypothetical protein [Spirochaetaceae bacterium]|tara:strand:+ start:109243 stop:109650 length:408 start_codon:yes stop_codon:yes gene_type:complete